jgi:GPH family glycoside/pentoside/hexuronide:cation symporter
MTALVIAASIFAVKAGVAFGSAIPGFMLALTGFETGAQQSQSAMLGIQLAFAVIPAAVMVPAAIALMFYGINRKVIDKVEADLSVWRTTPFTSASGTV